MRVLLLSDCPPCGNYTGGLVLEQLVQCFAKPKLFQAIIANPQLRPEPPDLIGRNQSLILRKPRERRWQICSRPRWISAWSARVHETLQAVHVRRNLLPQVLEFMEENDIEHVWAVVQGQSVLRLALGITEHSQAPVSSQIWDPLGWWLRVNGLDARTRRLLAKDFDLLMRRSAAIGAASWEMAERYSQKYGTRAVALIPGIPDTLLCPSQAVASKDKTEFIIGMAGQLYASQEWQRLLVACQRLNWKVGERAIKIRLLGNSCALPVSGSVCVEFLGWRSQRETVELMSGCDLAFLPYWFDEAYREEAELSFPSKMSTYCAAKRPLLVHAPHYSSPVSFVATRNIGWTVTEESVDALSDAISDAVYSEELRFERGERAGRVFGEELNAQRMQQSFRKFLPMLSE